MIHSESCPSFYYQAQKSKLKNCSITKKKKKKYCINSIKLKIISLVKVPCLIHLSKCGRTFEISRIFYILSCEIMTNISILS